MQLAIRYKICIMKGSKSLRKASTCNIFHHANKTRVPPLLILTKLKPYDIKILTALNRTTVDKFC